MITFEPPYTKGIHRPKTRCSACTCDCLSGQWVGLCLTHSERAVLTRPLERGGGVPRTQLSDMTLPCRSVLSISS